jgi:hypothetical protein
MYMYSYKEMIISCRDQTFDIDCTTTNTVTQLSQMLVNPFLESSSFEASEVGVAEETCESDIR